MPESIIDEPLSDLENSEPAKARTGLPRDFVPRKNRYGRTRLLAENIYRLPDGREFVPCKPEGRLGGTGHEYSLLTELQYERRSRGSVYIRNDGRIFDYSDSSASGRDLFDTGFRIEDLERTGHYASRAREKKHRHKKSKPSKSRVSHG